MTENIETLIPEGMQRQFSSSMSTEKLIIAAELVNAVSKRPGITNIKLTWQVLEVNGDDIPMPSITIEADGEIEKYVGDL